MKSSKEIMDLRIEFVATMSALIHGALIDSEEALATMYKVDKILAEVGLDLIYKEEEK